MIYVCCDERRRDAVRAHRTLNGIDFLEVLDDLTLVVHFLKPLGRDAVAREQVRIEGGERIRDVTVTEITEGTGAQANVLAVQVDKVGDFSIYTLRLIQDAQHPQPPAGFDPLLAAVTFAFQVERLTDFDCQPVTRLPPCRATRARDKLPGEGLRQLAPPGARSSGGAHARLDRAPPSRPGRDPRRATRLRRRLSELPAGCHCHRGVPRDGPASRLSAAPRPTGGLRDARRL